MKCIPNVSYSLRGFDIKIKAIKYPLSFSLLFKYNVSVFAV